MYSKKVFFYLIILARIKQLFKYLLKIILVKIYRLSFFFLIILLYTSHLIKKLLQTLNYTTNNISLDL